VGGWVNPMKYLVPQLQAALVNTQLVYNMTANETNTYTHTTQDIPKPSVSLLLTGNIPGLTTSAATMRHAMYALSCPKLIGFMFATHMILAPRCVVTP
jgi:hypothetical protein